MTTPHRRPSTDVLERVGRSMRQGPTQDWEGRLPAMPKGTSGSVGQSSQLESDAGSNLVSEHITLLAVENQSLAASGVALRWDRAEGPPMGIDGFEAAVDQLAANGVLEDIPISQTGRLLVHMWLRLLGEHEVAWSGFLTRNGTDMPQTNGATGIGDQVDARYKALWAEANDTFRGVLTHYGAGALWGDPDVLWGDPDVLWGSGGMVVQEGWIDLTLFAERRSASPGPFVPTPSPALTTADVQQPNVDGRAVDVAGACLTLSGLSDVPTVEYTRSTSFDAGAFNLATEIDVNMPLGHGGTLVALVMCSEEGSGIGMSADDAGWTKVLDMNSVSSVFDSHGAVFTKDGDGTEGASQQFSTDDPARMWNAVVLRVAGVDAVDAATAVFGINETSNPSVAADVPAPSPATDSALALWAAFSGNSGADDAGLTVVHDGAEQIAVASVGTGTAFWNAALWGSEVTVP